MQNDITTIPLVWKSLSVFMNPATKALGNAASHSSRFRFEGMAFKILFKRFSLEYMAAAEPLCPSNNCKNK